MEYHCVQFGRIGIVRIKQVGMHVPNQLQL